MEHRYKGKSYRLQLNNAGLIVNEDFGIAAVTAAEVKKMIEQKVDASKKVEPVSVLISGGRYDNEIRSYTEAKAKPINVGNSKYPEVWVSWKDRHGDNQRAKKNTYSVYLDTTENRKLLDEIVDVRRQVEILRQRESELIQALQRLEVE